MFVNQGYVIVAWTPKTIFVLYLFPWSIGPSPFLHHDRSPRHYACSGYYSRDISRPFHPRAYLGRSEQLPNKLELDLCTFVGPAASISLFRKGS